MSAINRYLSDRLNQIKECDVVFFCHDVDRGINLHGKAYSPIIDSIRDDLEKRGLHCLSIQYPWAECYGLKGHGNPLSINRSYFINRVKDKIKNSFYKHGLSRSAPTAIFELYSYIIRKAKPKCIICIGAPIELCRAANMQKVLLVEVLHGIGYAFIPWGYDARSAEDLPNIILALDNVSTEAFSKLDFLGVRTIKIPHPFLKLFYNKGLRASLPNEWIYQTRPNSIKFKKIILFSLQWGYSNDHDALSKFKNILTNGLFPDCFAQIISDDETIFWRFRLHPVQLRLKKYSGLIRYLSDFCKDKKNCEWRISSELPLPAVLANCDAHISMSSMSAYEAAYMGVPSLMLCPTLQPNEVFEELFSDLEATLYAKKSLIIPSEVISWIESVEKKPPLECDLGNEAAWEYAVSVMLGKNKLNC